jgi:hypothetical protein
MLEIDGIREENVSLELIILTDTVDVVTGTGLHPQVGA